MSKNKNNVLSGTIYLTVASLIFMGSGYAVNVTLGRLLGPSGYGIYGVLISFMTVMNIMQLAGVPQAVSKFAAQSKRDADSVLATGIRIQLILTVVLSVTFFLMAPLLANVFKEPSLTNYVRAISLIFPLYGMFAIYSGYYNGLHRFKRQALIYIVYSVAKLITVIILAIIFGLYGAIAGFVISPFIALMFGFKIPRAASLFSYRTLIFYSLPLIGFAVLTTTQLSIDLFSLKALVRSAEVAGFYVAAQNIALIPYLGMSAIGQVLFPSVSRFLGEGKVRETSQLIGRSLRYLLIILVPLVALIFATAPNIIKLLYGPKYLPAVTPLRILLAGYLLLTIFAMFANVLNGAGRAKTSMLIAAIGVTVGFVGCLILIPNYQANGAAIATLSGAAIVVCCSFAATYRAFRFRIYYFGIIKILAASAIIFIGGWLIPVPIALLPLEYILLGAVYFIALHLMGEITLQDREHIKNLLPSWFPLARWL